MATALKTPPAGMTGAVRSLQWTIQDLNGSVEHLAQSHDVLRRAQNIMAWTTAIFGVLLLSGLVWIANDIFHVKDQIMETDRRFDGVEAQISALGTRMEDLNLTVEQVGAELLASRGVPAPAAAGPQVSVLSTPTDTANVAAAAGLAQQVQALDAAALPQQANPAPQASQQVAAAPTPAPAPATPAPALSAEVTANALTEAVATPAPDTLPAVAPSPPAPRDLLTPEELAQQSPVTLAAAPANTAPAAEAPAAAAPAAAEPADSAAAATTVAAAPAEETPAPAAEAPAPAAVAAPAADLSDDQLLSYNDDQIDPADELLLLDENGNPQ